ncbi:hypothetical protein MMC18_007926 [Xylographa bjoerkii]|nr:hypothetical protein [Xylographa bjoerkii]
MEVGSLASLFTICVQYFNSIQLGQAWDDDDEIFRTKLDHQKTRFMVWGKALGLDDSDHTESKFEHSELWPAIVRAMRCMINCLDESRMFPSNHDPAQANFKDSFVPAQRFEKGGTFRKKLGRLWHRLICSHIRCRRRAAVASVILDHEKMAALIEELRELINSLESITKLPRQLERQPVVTINCGTKIEINFTCVELDQLAASIDHCTLPTRQDVFAKIVEKDGLSRKALLHKLKKERRQSCPYTASVKRIMSDLSQVDDYDGLQESFSLAPIDGDIFNCLGTIYGPGGTPYEGGIFYLRIEFPPNYPFEPPRIRFLTKVFHPNIKPDGHMCLDVLRENWSPALTISRMLLMISSFLDNPNSDQSVIQKAAKQYKENIGAYERTVRLYVKRYATGELPSRHEMRYESPASVTLCQRPQLSTAISASEDSWLQENWRLDGPVEEQSSTRTEKSGS